MKGYSIIKYSKSTAIEPLGMRKYERVQFMRKKHTDNQIHA